MDAIESIVDIDTITLTTDQAAALVAIQDFIMDPIEQVFVLKGSSGCGKSTLVRKIIDEIPRMIQMARMVDEDQKQYRVELTATTNKAAENLSELSGMEAVTIHSFLSLKLVTDHKTGKTSLVTRPNTEQSDAILFVDEASFIDPELLGLIFKQTKGCKIIFIGDPYQLRTVGAFNTPVFDTTAFKSAALEQPVRQANGSPIIDLSVKFREAVKTGESFRFKPDGTVIRRLSRDDFNAEVLAEFGRPDWAYKDSKVLAWTNKRVVAYNEFINEHKNGVPHFQKGDYAVNNSFVSSGKVSIKTDALVHIQDISEPFEHLGVWGRDYTVNGINFFRPEDPQEAKERVKRGRAKDEFEVLRIINDTWIDLRAVFAQTINKSQGSTYGKVYIDLDDIGNCNVKDQLYRMLYVGVSRAKYGVIFTGDL